MAKFKVIGDKGVVIGGKHHPHGSVIDSGALLPEPGPVLLAEDADDAAKAAHAEQVKAQAEAHKAAQKQADDDLAALLERGTVQGDGGPLLEPADEKEA